MELASILLCCSVKCCPLITIITFNLVLSEFSTCERTPLRDRFCASFSSNSTLLALSLAGKEYVVEATLYYNPSIPLGYGDIVIYRNLAC